MADITLSVSLAITSPVTGGISALSKTLNFSAPDYYDNEPQNTSTTIADITMNGGVTAANVSMLALQNLSSTVGEDIYVLFYPKLDGGGGGDMIDGGSVAGASVTAAPTACTYYLISADGTSNGTSWKKGDIAMYLGSSGKYGQFSPQIALLNPGRALLVPLAGSYNAYSGLLKCFSATGTPQLAKFAIGPSALP